jgi:hypothetical protein
MEGRRSGVAAELGRDVNADVVTRAVVDLAGTLRLLILAEGVENP